VLLQVVLLQVVLLQVVLLQAVLLQVVLLQAVLLQVASPPALRQRPQCWCRHHRRIPARSAT
jgi:hypothetical protein